MAAPMENMSETSSGNKYRIEVTVVTGFEDVAKEEAEEKLGVSVDTKQGRIGFELPIEDVTKVLQLGSANHCMVVMKHIENYNFTDNEHDNLLRLRGLAGEMDWPVGLKVWSKFFSFEHPIKDLPDAIPTDYGEVTLLANINKSTMSRAKKIKQRLAKRRGKKTKFPLSNNKQANLGNSAQKSNEAIRDRVDEVGNQEGNKDIAEQAIDSPRTIDDSPKQQEEITDALQNVLEVTSQKDNSDDTQNKPNPEQTDNGDEAKTKLGESEENQAKKPRTRLNPWNPLMPSFRVTCNRSGEGHTFHSMDAAANLGGGIWSYFGWNVKMTEMDIEVIMNITNQEVTLGIGLTREALHKGNIKEFGSTTLRPSICYGLLRLCDIKPGDVVCDPMCGVGSIPIQGAFHWPQGFHIGGDIIGNVIKRSKTNFDFVNEQSIEKKKLNFPTDVLRWNACHMPLRNQSIDVFISDLPFGIRSGTKKENWQLYRDSLSEMARCSKPRQTRACFLTEDKNCMIKTLQKLGKYWSRTKTLSVNIGGLSAGVYLLKRTAEEYEHPTEDGGK